LKKTGHSLAQRARPSSSLATRHLSVLVRFKEHRMDVKAVLSKPTSQGNSGWLALLRARYARYNRRIPRPESAHQLVDRLHDFLVFSVSLRLGG